MYGGNWAYGKDEGKSAATRKQKSVLEIARVGSSNLEKWGKGEEGRGGDENDESENFK